MEEEETDLHEELDGAVDGAGVGEVGLHHRVEGGQVPQHSAGHHLGCRGAGGAGAGGGGGSGGGGVEEEQEEQEEQVMEEELTPSLAFMRLRLPLSVLISPLWAM